jgi:hypothetical protein
LRRRRREGLVFNQGTGHAEGEPGKLARLSEEPGSEDPEVVRRGGTDLRDLPRRPPGALLLVVADMVVKRGV